MDKIKYAPLEVLGLPFNAAHKEIKAAYKKLIRLYTPENDPEKFMSIRAAYESFIEERQAGPPYPIYKRPFTVISEKSKEKSLKADLPIQILATVFETPFDTHGDIDQLLKESAAQMGFIEK